MSTWNHKDSQWSTSASPAINDNRRRGSEVSTSSRATPQFAVSRTMVGRSPQRRRPSEQTDGSEGEISVSEKELTYPSERDLDFLDFEHASDGETEVVEFKEEAGESNGVDNGGLLARTDTARNADPHGDGHNGADEAESVVVESGPMLDYSYDDSSVVVGKCDCCRHESVPVDQLGHCEVCESHCCGRCVTRRKCHLCSGREFCPLLPAEADDKRLFAVAEGQLPRSSPGLTPNVLLESSAAIQSVRQKSYSTVASRSSYVDKERSRATQRNAIRLQSHEKGLVLKGAHKTIGERSLTLEITGNHQEIEKTKQAIEQLEWEVKKLRESIMIREGDLGRLEWLKECCRGRGEDIPIGDFMHHIGEKWDDTEYTTLKNLIEQIRRIVKDRYVACKNITGSSTSRSSSRMPADSGVSPEAEDAFKVVLKSLSDLQSAAFPIASVAPKFDVAENVRGNGWRSLLEVLECSLDAVIKYLESKDKKWWRTLDSSNTFVRYLQTWLRMLNIGTEAILENSATGSLFPTEGYEGVLHRLMGLPLQVFYGSFFGVHYTRGLRQILGLLLVAMASYGDGVKSGDGIKGKFRAVMTSTKYLAFNKKAAFRTVELFNAGEVAFLKAFWHLQENVSFVEIDTAIRTPTPDVNLVFRIPVEILNMRASSGKGKVLVDVPDMFVRHHERHHSDKHYQQQEERNKREQAEGDGTHLDMGESELQKKVEFDRHLERGVFQSVQVRLISYNRLEGQLSSTSAYEKQYRQAQTGDSGESSVRLESSSGGVELNGSTDDAEKKKKDKKSKKSKEKEKNAKEESVLQPMSKGLMIHIHGGGFVAQTSKAHLNYLRDYAKSLRVPILSIDYSLSPECPFPQPLYEAFYAYCWAIENAAMLGSTGEIVVVNGDSAGANLVIALTMLSIELGIRVPDVIVPIYPALLAKRIPSPARLLSVMDPLLGTGVLLQCLYCYSCGLEVFDQYMSPAICRDELLRKFPRCHVIVGKLDPLLDDSLLFSKNLLRSGNAVWLEMLNGLPHGFLGFNRVCGEATKGTKVAIRHLRFAFGIDQQEPCRMVGASQPHHNFRLLGDNSEFRKVNSTLNLTNEEDMNMSTDDVRVTDLDAGDYVFVSVHKTNPDTTPSSLIGYIRYHNAGKFVVEPLDCNDTSFKFRVIARKKVPKGYSGDADTLHGIKCVKNGKYISRSHFSNLACSTTRMWDHETIEIDATTSKPQVWRIYKNGLTDPVPFRISKDGRNICCASSNIPNPLFFIIQKST